MKDLFERYIEEKDWSVLKGREILETLKDDYDEFCDSKDEVSFEGWIGFDKNSYDNDMKYVIDGMINFAPIPKEELESLLKNAEELLVKFFEAEYGKKSSSIEIEDLRKISVAHTETEDGKHDIDVEIDLIKNSINRFVDGEMIYSKSYSDLKDLINNELVYLDFQELIDEYGVEEYLREKNRKIWKVPVTWEMCGFVEVEADTAEDAVHLVVEDLDDMPLPKGYYVDDSFRVSSDVLDEVMDMVERVK